MHSNFITPPDLVETVLIVNATDEQIRLCGEACRDSGRVYNVYLYHTDMKDHDWLAEVVQRADTILEQQSAQAPVLCPTVKFGPDHEIQQPHEYFNK